MPKKKEISQEKEINRLKKLRLTKDKPDRQLLTDVP